MDNVKLLDFVNKNKFPLSIFNFTLIINYMVVATGLEPVTPTMSR
jgi:hypothetical protein